MSIYVSNIEHEWALKGETTLSFHSTIVLVIKTGKVQYRHDIPALNRQYKDAIDML